MKQEDAALIIIFLVGVVIGFLVGVGFLSSSHERYGARKAGAVEKCWKTAASDRDCRMVCPGYDPFKVEEVK